MRNADLLTSEKDWSTRHKFTLSQFVSFQLLSGSLPICFALWPHVIAIYLLDARSKDKSRKDTRVATRPTPTPERCGIDTCVLSSSPSIKMGILGWGVNYLKFCSYIILRASRVWFVIFSKYLMKMN